MNREQPAPVEGPVVLGVIGKCPAPEAAPKGAAPGQSAVTTIIALCGAACFGLSLGALIHREFYGLWWLLLGLFPLTCVRLLAGRANRFLSDESREPAVPDERTLVRVDRLKAYTASGALGTAVKATGATLWLTEEGMYLASGQRLPWSRFTAFDLDSPSPSAYRIRLWKRRYSRRSLAVAVLAGVILACGGAAEVTAAAVGFHRFGLRDDVLALASASVLGLLVAGYVPLFLRSRMRGSSGSPPDNLVLVSRPPFQSLSLVELPTNLADDGF